MIFLMCFPITILTLKGKNNMDYKKFFTLKTFGTIAFAYFIGSSGTQLYIASSKYTLISHTAILANSGGVFVVMYNYVTGKHVHKLEMIGTGIIVIASIIFINDPYSEKQSADSNILYGDLLALLAAPLYMLDTLFFDNLKDFIPGFVLVHVCSVFAIIYYSIFAFFEPGFEHDKFLSMDVQFGLFGWATQKYIWISLILVGPIAGVLGIGASIYLLMFFSPIVYMNMILLDPFVGQLLGKSNQTL